MIAVAYKENRIAELPVKIKKTKVLNLFHHYLVTITPSGKTILRERSQSGIWAGLYEFPYVEANGALLPHELMAHESLKMYLEEFAFAKAYTINSPSYIS